MLMACAPTGRYQQKKDSVPSRIPTLLEQQDAIPRAEEKSRGGNKNYTVRGKNYTVLSTSQGYKEEGIASFYGEKFHGHHTSNGEIYNMFSMTAAHKSLPLPTYVKVTNLDNQKTAIVRVNDRGPFHPGRIIDLSYSAAYKLGINGIANVLVEAINVNENSPTPLYTSPDDNQKITTAHNQSTIQNSVPEQSVLPVEAAPSALVQPNDSIAQVGTNAALTKKSFIQVFVTSKTDIAKNLVSSLTTQYEQPIYVHQQNNLHHILMGPFTSSHEQIELLEQLKISGYSGAFNKELALP